MQGISINVSYAGDRREVTIVSVSGYIDTTTAPEVQLVISEQVALNRFKIVIDLGGVDYISSTGWGVFISELKDIRANGGDLVLVGMVTNVYNIYELMEFSQILKSFSDADAGTEYFIGQRAASGQGVNKPRTVVSGSQAAGTASAAASGGGSGSLNTPLFTSTDAREKKAKNRAAEQTMAYKIGSYRNEVLHVTGYTLGKAIVKVIMDQPYLSVKEIARALQLPQYGGRKHRAHAVKHELKQMELLGQRERFEFIMNYRGAERGLSL
jgi:anti-sigma B factor antagonist